MKRHAVIMALLLGALCAPGSAAADVIGVNTPAEALTPERIAALPASEREAWAAYLARSEEQMRLDRATLAAELSPDQIPPPPPLAAGGGPGGAVLDRDAAWYGTAEARAVADTIVSFQTPAGGWSKNQNRAGPPRRPGQRYSNNAETMAVGTGSFDTPRDRFWTFVGTFDNGATTTEMRFLARVASQAPGPEGDAYRASFLRGVSYILAAQLPNGGWPQIWPLEGGFHDGITFNDNVVAEAAMLLDEVGAGQGDFSFVPADLRARAGVSARRGVEIILAAQVVVQGRRTIWAQQVDALTLAPISARNYEPRSLASAESSDVLMFLMRQPNPSPALRQAVRDGVAWLREHAITDHAWTMTPEGRQLIPSLGAGPIWSRLYDINTGAPIFGDVDKTIHDDVNGISRERRNGYNWYNTAPQRVLDAFPTWNDANPS